MPVHFVETMRGRLRSPDGRERAAEIEIKVTAPRWLAFLRDGAGEVAGIVRAAPWADEVEARGSLAISVARGTIDYHIEFSGPSGPLTLAGQKRWHAGAPLASATTLPVELRDTAGQVLAHGALRFDLGDLAPFIASWLPVGRATARLDSRRRAVVRRAIAEV